MHVTRLTSKAQLHLSVHVLTIPSQCLFCQQGSVEFEEDGIEASSPHTAAQQTAPVPLDDAALDAYLQADEPAAQAPAVPPAETAEETETEGLSNDADAVTAYELHAEPSAEQQMQASSTSGDNHELPMQTADDPAHTRAGLLEACSSEEELLESVIEHPAADGPAQCQDLPCELPAQPAATAPYSPAVPYSSSSSSVLGSQAAAGSNAGSSARSSKRSSRTASVAGAHAFEPTSHLQEPAQQQVAPAVAEALYNADAQVYAHSPHTSMQRDSAGDGWISNAVRPKARPASASPVVRRSSSTRDRAQEQQPYSPPTGSQARSQQQQALEVMPVASWTGMC